MTTNCLNTFARNYLPSAIYNHLPSTSFWKQAAKFGKIFPLAYFAWNAATNGQVATLSNLGMLVLGGLLHYISLPSKGPNPPLPKLSSHIESNVLSFLTYPELCIFSSISKGAQASRNRNNSQLERAIFSKIRIFDRAQWKAVWNRDVTSQYDADKIHARTLKTFLNAYYGPNPIGPGRVCDHSLIPVVVPEDLCFNELGELIQHPLKGYTAKLDPNTRAMEQHGRVPSGYTRLVIKMREVIGRELPCPGQVAAIRSLPVGWRNLPNAFSQNTVILAHHAITGERYHGNKTGMEGCPTNGRTVEVVSNYFGNVFPMISGYFGGVFPSDASPPQFCIDSDCGEGYDTAVVGVQQEFRNNI